MLRDLPCSEHGGTVALMSLTGRTPRKSDTLWYETLVSEPQNTVADLPNARTYGSGPQYRVYKVHVRRSVIVY